MIIKRNFLVECMMMSNYYRLLFKTKKKRRKKTTNENRTNYNPSYRWFQNFLSNYRRAQQNDEQAIHEERSCQTQQGQDIDNSTRQSVRCHEFPKRASRRWRGSVGPFGHRWFRGLRRRWPLHRRFWPNDEISGRRIGRVRKDGQPA